MQILPRLLSNRGKVLHIETEFGTMTTEGEINAIQKSNFRRYPLHRGDL